MDQHIELMQEYSAELGLDTGAADHAWISTAKADEGYLAANLPVLALATGSVATFVTAANRYRRAVGLDEQRSVLAADRIAASFTGDRMMRIDGEPISGLAELSGFFAAADGWVRTHANYPHHRARLLQVLGLGPGASRFDVADRIVDIPAAELESSAANAGAIAVRVRNELDWTTDSTGRAAADGPLVRIAVRDKSPNPDSGSGDPTDTLPLRGIRVLDLTRVISGPVATRALALLGAEVLRIDSPRLREIEWQHLETGQGKRTALLDLHDDADSRHFRGLLAKADVLVTGYRPGALQRLGIRAASLPPGLVHGHVRAWGATGPWSGRRGFDSIVQAASGIAVIEGSAKAPGALPAQALDHATGYLLAAGILDSLAGTVSDNRGREVEVALARTGSWLLRAPERDNTHGEPTHPGDDTVVTNGNITTARPALSEFDDYPFPARPWGQDQPKWNATE